MRIEILSLFPDYFRSPFEQSIIGRAMAQGIVEVGLHQIRDWATGSYKKVDDRPYGGGPGMVMMPEPIVSAIRSVKKEKSHVVALTPVGTPLTAKKARTLSEKKHLIILCGHYEGIDARAIDLEVDEEISIGDFVLTNGCAAAVVLTDAVCRFLPGVLGHEEGADSESFEEGLLDPHPHTRPEVFEGLSVPPILLSGDHKEIEKWRREEALKLTRDRRADLLQKEWKTEGVEAGSCSISSITLTVKKLSRTLSFCRRALGLQAEKTGEFEATVKIGGQTLRFIEGSYVSDELRTISITVSSEEWPVISQKIANFDKLTQDKKGGDALQYLDPNGILWMIANKEQKR